MFKQGIVKTYVQTVYWTKKSAQKFGLKTWFTKKSFSYQVIHQNTVTAMSRTNNKSSTLKNFVKFFTIIKIVYWTTKKGAQKNLGL